MEKLNLKKGQVWLTRNGGKVIVDGASESPMYPVLVKNRHGHAFLVDANGFHVSRKQPDALDLVELDEPDKSDAPSDPIRLADPQSALDVQVGGSHYKDMAIQPVEFIHRNGIGFIAGNVIKYVCRADKKGGLEDLKKARHYIDILIEMEAMK